MPPKRTSTSEASAMTQATIKKLVADSVSAALEAQAANMANTNNTTRPREAPIARQCSYKEFMSCQPINFNNCTEDCKVKFATGTLTEEDASLVYLNSFAQPIRIEEAYKITGGQCEKIPGIGRPFTVHACGRVSAFYAQIVLKDTNNNAQGRAYMLRDRNAHQDPNVVTGMFLLNQHLAKVLFDSGANKSFVSISLASMLNIPPIIIDTFYNIEMADENLVSTNTVIQGTILTLLNQPFEIDLMPIKLGSFEVVIGMDWLSKYHVEIICDDVESSTSPVKVRDRVMLKVSPRKGFIRFRKRGNLNPRYIGPFKIFERIGPLAYKPELPKELGNVHSTFYVSNLKKCLSDESLVIPMKELRLDDKLNFVEEPVEIMD
ncbi:reverse transcriptase domain-containing protein [Tanacetum coccineum]